MMPKPHPARCSNGHEFDSFLSKCPDCRSMNIEIEQTAFDLYTGKVHGPAAIQRQEDGSYRWRETKVNFDTWLAAKQHAKPLASIKKIDYQTRSTLNIPWYTVEGTCCKCEHQTREACEEWAVANGYRLE